MKPETDSIMLFSIENMRLRFPHLFEGVFVLLNQNDLAKCREVDRFLQESLDEKFWWIRKIQFHLEEIQCQLKNSYPEFTNDWRLIVTKTSLDSLKKFHVCLVRFLDNVNYMNMNSQYLSPIIVLAIFGDVNLFREITVLLKNVYPKPQTGSCLLHIVALYGNLDTFKAIVEKSEEENAVSQNCRSLQVPVASIAAASGRLELFQYMLQKFEGLYENICNYSELSPLHLAAKNGHLEVCKFIIENVSNIYTRDYTGKTPLHLAAANGNLETCKLLWKHCEEKNIPDLFGWTPLHCAAMHGQLDVYNFILEQVNDKKPLDIDGHTPISLAKNKQCPCHDHEPQLWKFDGKLLKSYTLYLHYNIKWKVTSKDKLIYIQNNSNNKVLGTGNCAKIIEEDLEEGKPEQLWKVGKPNAEGYFTLENFKVPKLLTATSSPSMLRIEGKFEK